MLTTSKSNGGPGLQRMTDNVGPEGTEALRRQVLADQAAAKTAAAQTAKKVPAKNKPKAKAAEQAKPALKAPTKKPVAPPPAQARFAATAKITVVAKENPHHQGSKDFGKFKKLKNGMTVEKALAAEVDRGYLNYMVRRELIAIR